MLQIVLLAGKFIFLIILYVFLYRIVRSTTRELRATRPAPLPQPPPPVPAVVLSSPASGHAAPPAGAVWSLVVERSPVLRAGEVFTITPGVPVLAGRSSDMDIHLEDTFVSSKHVLFEGGPAGLRAEDLLSTNGTQVNGGDISEPTLLSPGDRVEVGDTIFRVEVQ
jgi:pSer/pThr/pTyr-binding forkhead associated (FHA) protein